MKKLIFLMIVLSLFVLMLYGSRTTLTGYNFKINAIYHAPQSGFKLIIDSEGFVKSGSDISDSYKGTVKIEPLNNKGKASKVILTFEDNDDVLYKINSGENQKAKWGFREDLNVFNEILTNASYVKINENEIKESIRAIGGVFSGPKGVILKGQSKHIVAIKVDLGKN